MNENTKFTLASCIATFFGVGNVKYAPGTMGSLATFPLFLVITYLILKAGIVSPLHISMVYIIDLVVLYILAYWSINIYITTNKKDDPSEVVIDEVIGQLIAYMLPTLFLPNNPTNPNLLNWLYILLPFPFFRLFDITKWNLVGYFDKKHGAHNIILDDVVAGIYAGICVILILRFI